MTVDTMDVQVEKDGKGIFTHQKIRELAFYTYSYPHHLPE